MVLEVHIFLYFVKSNKLAMNLLLRALCTHWDIDDKTDL